MEHGINMAVRQQKLDKKAREDGLNRDLREAPKRTVSFPELVVGSKVSYRGGYFTVEAVQGWVEGETNSAKLKGKETHVEFDELRPLGS